MYTVVRSYSGPGASELFELLGAQQEDIRDLIGGVPGFVSYSATQTADDAGITVTICEDKTGTDESSRRAADYVRDNLSAGGGPPVISEGTTVLQF